jgi:hypothetical protein
MTIKDMSGHEEHCPESLLPNTCVGPQFASEKSVAARIENYRWVLLVCSIKEGCLSCRRRTVNVLSKHDQPIS